MAGGGKSKKSRGGGANLATAPGVLRTENRKAGSKLGSQPRNYQFTPAKEAATVNPTPRVHAAQPPTGPGVKDYPPPTRLFQSPTTVPGVSSSGNYQPQPQQSPPATHLAPPANRQYQPASPNFPQATQNPQSQPRRSFSHPLLSGQPPLQTISQSPEATSLPAQIPSHQPQCRQSPHSSQAQNDVDADEETDDEVAKDFNGNMEPTLSEDVLAAVNDLLRLENRDQYCEVLSPIVEPDTTW